MTTVTATELEFQSAAIASLLRRLHKAQNYKEEIENLRIGSQFYFFSIFSLFYLEYVFEPHVRQAIRSKDPESKCIRVTRSKDGRMQSKF
jgi:hypothetical protein